MNQQFLHREAMFPRDPAVFRRGFCEFPRDRAVFRWGFCELSLKNEVDSESSQKTESKNRPITRKLTKDRVEKSSGHKETSLRDVKTFGLYMFGWGTLLLMSLYFLYWLHTHCTELPSPAMRCSSALTDYFVPWRFLHTMWGTCRRRNSPRNTILEWCETSRISCLIANNTTRFQCP